MELRHLRYFVAVADELSFTRGAEKLRIAQPSLTRQIRDLEEELKVRLLDRTKKKVTLTKEGEFFLERAKRLLGFSDELIRGVHEFDHKVSHTVNIGYVANPFHRVLPATLTAFEKEFPEISINLFGIPAADQIVAVRDGKLDVGFVGLLEPTEDSDLQFLLVGSYKAVAVMPRSKPQPKTGIINFTDLAQTFFIAVSEKCYPGYSRWFKSTCDRFGIRAKIVQTVDNDSALIQAVRSGLGVALLPEQIKQVAHDNIVIKNVGPPILFPSTIVWRKDNQSAGLKAYLQVVMNIRGEKRFGVDRNGSA
ncbi:MAG TPA: LysR substrate-binding domain-containing protein [Terriglobales bacterium]|nr:LysR substrate-binding domain-containing protein [Terriglobales bacterium]